MSSYKAVLLSKALKIMPALSERESFPNREEYLESMGILLQRKENRVLFPRVSSKFKIVLDK